MNDAERAIARGIPASNKQTRREAEVASMFPAADLLPDCCRDLVEMVDAHAATNLLLLQLQNVVNSAISAIRLEIVTEAATAAELIKEAQDAVATKAVAKEGARIAEPIDAAAIGLAVSNKICTKDRRRDRNWRKAVATIVANEIRKAEVTRAKAKEDERTSPVGTDATSPVARMEADDRSEESAKAIASAIVDGDVEGATSAFSHMCGWAETEDDSHAGAAGRIEEDVMRKAAILSGGGCPHCERERLQNESRLSPLSALSETDYGGMVGAVDLHLLENPEGSIITLASMAQVSLDQMRAYVARADHLVRDHRDIVRLGSGGG